MEGVGGVGERGEWGDGETGSRQLISDRVANPIVSE
jgi:hypothetical protein